MQQYDNILYCIHVLYKTWLHYMGMAEVICPSLFFLKIVPNIFCIFGNFCNFARSSNKVLWVWTTRNYLSTARSILEVNKTRMGKGQDIRKWYKGGKTPVDYTWWISGLTSCQTKRINKILKNTCMVLEKKKKKNEQLSRKFSAGKVTQGHFDSWNISIAELKTAANPLRPGLCSVQRPALQSNWDKAHDFCKPEKQYNNNNNAKKKKKKKKKFSTDAKWQYGRLVNKAGARAARGAGAELDLLMENS